MTSRERIRLAMQHKTPDRVPVWCQLSTGHIERFGRADGQPPATPDQFAQAAADLARRYRFDGILVLDPGARQERDARGSEINTMAMVGRGGEPYAGQEFTTIDPAQWPRQATTFTAADFYGVARLRRLADPGLHVGGWTPDAFNHAVNWVAAGPQGLSGAMLAIGEDRERFAALVEYYRPVTVAWTVAQIALGGVESIHISSPYAGSSFLSQQDYQRLVLPGITDLAQAIRAAGAFSYIHNCGFIADRLELMASSGVDGLECMDPPPLGNVRLEDAQRRVRQQVFLKGNLDSVHELLGATDEEFETRVRQRLEVGSPGGGYILSTACSVAPETPPARLARLIDIVERAPR